MATHSSTLAWKIPWTEEPGGLQSMGLLRVRHYCRAPAPSVLYPASDIDWQIRFLHDSIHVSMPFSQIIPPSPSPTESKRLLYTSVSLLLSHIQDYQYHLSKFHIYVVVYCIGVFLSGLLHSV